MLSHDEVDEDAYLPLSGLQHFVFCDRQCALIHVDGLFPENHLTLEGRLAHRSVDRLTRRRRQQGDVETEVETDVWVRSDRLRVIGRADRIEVLRDRGTLEFRPVESKRARRRSLEADSVQLCAQAMAIEEMRGVNVIRGALYYVRQRRRLEVVFTAELRERTEQAARAYHALIASRQLPAARFDARCRDCSLRSVCLPHIVQDRRVVSRYLQRLLTPGG